MIIGTAGHIDHGKSALVTALTGRTVDRLAEERRRGITIDLNFAPLEIPGLPPAGIVDVPGHEDFVRTMVAGASGIDLVLLVVDAAEGMRPQTLEHLAIVEQLGIPAGLPVVTKADLVEPAWIELVLSELTERLAQSNVAFEAPAVVSAKTGAGIADLRGRIEGLIAGAVRRRADDLFRMPVDRVFSLAGVGTVVTGTAWSGFIGAGDPVDIASPAAGWREARVRSIEMYGATVPASAPGARVALGLVGVDRNEVARGSVVVGPGAGWRQVTAIDGMLQVLPDAPRDLAARTRLRVLHGTAEVIGRVYPRQPIPPGGTGMARLALERPLVVRRGDRGVLRSYSPVRTIGGFLVLDPSPPRRAPWPEAMSEPGGPGAEALILRRRDGVTEGDLPVLLGVPLEPAAQLLAARPALRRLRTRAGARWIAAATVEGVRETVVATLRAHHRTEPSQPGLSLETVRKAGHGDEAVAEAALADLTASGDIVVEAGVAALNGFRPRIAGGDAAIDAVLRAIADGGMTPPALRDLEGQCNGIDVVGALRLAQAEGRVEQVERDRWYLPETLREFRAILTETAGGAAGEILPAALRERTGLSRKYLIPLLEWADRQGLTRRTGDRRVLVAVPPRPPNEPGT